MSKRDKPVLVNDRDILEILADLRDGESVMISGDELRQVIELKPGLCRLGLLDEN